MSLFQTNLYFDACLIRKSSHIEAAALRKFSGIINEARQVHQLYRQVSAKTEKFCSQRDIQQAVYDLFEVPQTFLSSFYTRISKLDIDHLNNSEHQSFIIELISRQKSGMTILFTAELHRFDPYIKLYLNSIQFNEQPIPATYLTELQSILALLISRLDAVNLNKSIKFELCLNSWNYFLMHAALVQCVHIAANDVLGADYFCMALEDTLQVGESNIFLQTSLDEGIVMNFSYYMPLTTFLNNNRKTVNLYERSIPLLLQIVDERPNAAAINAGSYELMNNCIKPNYQHVLDCDVLKRVIGRTFNP